MKIPRKSLAAFLLVSVCLISCTKEMSSCPVWKCDGGNFLLSASDEEAAFHAVYAGDKTKTMKDFQCRCKLISSGQK